LIRGALKFDASLIGDFVIAKNLNSALFVFSVTVDDHEMRITHVIRGEDHINNVPKQLALQAALGFKEPIFAHLPLILNQDRSKISKRFNATSVSDYRERGYLPEALLNFLALLGWHPAGNREAFSREELIRVFNLDRIQKSGAIFNLEKLDWLNAAYIRELKDEELASRLGLTPEKKNLRVVALVKDRLKRLSDFPVLTRFIKNPIEYSVELLAWKGATSLATKATLEATKKVVSVLPAEKFTEASLTEALKPLLNKFGTGNVLWPLRVALSGEKNSPGPYEIMPVLGKEEVLQRISHAIEKL
jgi:glutamyl-tRNA synthetase